MDDRILIRHILLIAVKEINNDLIKINKPYRLNFGDEMHHHFVDENEAYYKKHKLYNDDGTLNQNKLFERSEYLNKMVRSCTFGNKLFLMPKTIETSLYELLF